MFAFVIGEDNTKARGAKGRAEGRPRGERGYQQRFVCLYVTSSKLKLPLSNTPLQASLRQDYSLSPCSSAAYSALLLRFLSLALSPRTPRRFLATCQSHTRKTRSHRSRADHCATLLRNTHVSLFITCEINQATHTQPTPLTNPPPSSRLR